MEDNLTHQEWENRIIEKISQIPGEELLRMAQAVATHFAADLVTAVALFKKAETTEDDIREELCVMAARMMIYLDALQLRFGDFSDEELCFLKDVESCFEE